MKGSLFVPFFIRALVLLTLPQTADARHIGIHLEYFRHFSYSRESSSKWYVDEIFEARITVDDAGSYWLEMSVIEVGDGFPPEPDCLEEPLEPPVPDVCAKAVKLMERVLTEAEVEALMAAFAGLEIVSKEDSICEAIGAPARIDRFRWESVSGAEGPVAATDFLCAPPYLPAASALEIVELLERLRDGSRDCNRNGVFDALDIESLVSKDENGDAIPDECQPRFGRGDCNDDGAVDIGDPVATLFAVFLGQFAVTCDDACDSNDDGAVDAADVVVTLGVLFLGHGFLPPPGMTECGVDFTEDALGCETPPASCP